MAFLSRRDRKNSLQDLQQDISLEKNQSFIGKELKVIIDKKNQPEGNPQIPLKDLRSPLISVRPVGGERVHVNRRWWGLRAHASELRVELLAIPLERVDLLGDGVDALQDVIVGDKALDALETRARYLEVETLIVGDRYSFIRDSYMQYLDFESSDGEDQSDDFVDDMDDFLLD